MLHENPEAEAGDGHQGDLGRGHSDQSEPGDDGTRGQHPPDHVEPRLKAHPFVAEVHAPQHRLRHRGEAPQQQADQQRRARQPHGRVERRGHFGHGRRDPHQNGAEPREERQEQQPHDEGAADGAPMLQRIDRPLLRGDDETERFGGAPIGRGHVADQAVEHFPHAEQLAAEAAHEQRRDDQSDDEPRGVVEQRLHRVERGSLGQRHRDGRGRLEHVTLHARSPDRPQAPAPRAPREARRCFPGRRPLGRPGRSTRRSPRRTPAGMRRRTRRAPRRSCP